MSLHSSALLWATYWLCLSFDLWPLNPDCWDSDDSPPPLPMRTPESFLLATGACWRQSQVLRVLRIHRVAFRRRPLVSVMRRLGGGVCWCAGVVWWCQAAAKHELISALLWLIFVLNFTSGWHLDKHPTDADCLQTPKFIFPTPGVAFANCSWLSKMSTCTFFKAACI